MRVEEGEGKVLNDFLWKFIYLLVSMENKINAETLLENDAGITSAGCFPINICHYFCS